MNSSILEASVYHKRHFPIEYDFSHTVFYLNLNLADQDRIKKHKLFSINKFNFFCLYWSDYGFDKIKDPKKYILDTLSNFNLDNRKIKNITLITMPKILGYAFNPVSFWMCFDSENKLLAVLSEVNNTFGERHGYLCFNKNFKAIEAGDLLTYKKVFHVSPFCKVEGEYKFQFSVNEKNININIDYYKDSKPLISTSIKGKIIELSDKNLLKKLFTYSFSVIKVLILIYYHAFWLWIKKVPYIKKPNKPNKDIT
jgi:DUF1365 family protein